LPRLLELKTFSDSRGHLTVVEKVLPFEIKRVFYIYGVDDSVRGKHRHHTTVQAAICIKGSCNISTHDGTERRSFALDAPTKCLILEPRDWHAMHDFTPDAVLLVLASTNFDPADYIYEERP
jgi:hypothetical protein